jgi:hypothetical protein
MTHSTRNLAGGLAAGILVLAGLSGCATTANSVDSSAGLGQGTASNLVFGKFRLVRNGHEVAIGDGALSNTATFELRRDGAQTDISAEIGDGGEFAWVLEPGTYEVSGIGFRYHGDRIETPANFSFTVAGNQKATYVGTITLEASFHSVANGTIGAVDSYRVANDCATDCADRLSRLGLSTDGVNIALFPHVSQMARRN